MHQQALEKGWASGLTALPEGVFDLEESIRHIAHWLPSQQPIKDFVHHNTLHAVQNHPFHEGIAIAAKIYGAFSYLPLKDYLKRYEEGRISDLAINWAIHRSVADPLKQDQVRKLLFEDDQTAHFPPVSLAGQGIRERWLTHLEVNLNAMVQPVLFRLVANFLDQGISRWTISRPDESFFECVRRLVEGSLIPLYPFNGPFARALIQQEPEAVIRECLKTIVGNEALYEQYLLEMLLAHPGWSGMVRVIETGPLALLSPRKISLKEFIALELTLELAFVQIKRGAGFSAVAEVPGIDQADRLENVIASSSVPLVLKIWHDAMEFSLHAELLKALAPVNHGDSEHHTVPGEPIHPEVQALFCIDDREGSLRRHLEELNPLIETYGAAGFFGIDFLYQGIEDAYAVAQCPVVITPKHLVVESRIEPEPPKGRQTTSDLANLHVLSGSLLRGWLLTQTMGLSYAARLAFDVFRPGSKLLKITQLSEVNSHTRLHLLRDSRQPTRDGRFLGFSHEEMADKLEVLLRNIGLTENFAPLVVVVAHGSSSVNNPHFAAYDCGACAGKPGAPNARAFAWMANDRTVREILRARGIDIPLQTVFVAALHNTSRDEVTYFDLDPENHPIDGFKDFRDTMEKALQRNAHERCRWFELGPKANNPSVSHSHVQARASSIYEPRPELNHSNNLYCVVGRRNLTSNLFIDRRAFLHSYNPQSDANGDILVKILNAVIPVCGGINLEYLFSRIDNSMYGAGTKLPHNVIGLIGVANGVDGDLRTGLPSQMIEVHEPARLLIVVEQTTAVIEAACRQLGELKEWLDNEWVRLVACHPVTRNMMIYSKSGWEAISLGEADRAPESRSSDDIFVGHTDTIPAHILLKESA